MMRINYDENKIYYTNIFFFYISYNSFCLINFIFFLIFIHKIKIKLLHKIIINNQFNNKLIT